MWCWRKMLSTSWQEHRTNDSILTELVLERELMGRVAKLKLQYFGLITRGSAGQLALTVLEGIMEGLRHQGRPRRQWIDDTGCEYIQLKMSQDRAQWRRKISEWSSAVANPHRGRSTSEWVSEVNSAILDPFAKFEERSFIHSRNIEGFKIIRHRIKCGRARGRIWS